MPQITGFTKQRMDALDADIFNSAAVVGDNLTLSKKGGEVVNVGNVKGLTGDQGDAGAIGQTEVDAALAARQPGSWQAVPLPSGWSSGFDYVHGPARYRLDPDNRVRFGGSLTYAGSTVAINTSIVFGYLSAPYQPAKYRLISTGRDDGVDVDFRIYSNGQLLIYTGSHTLPYGINIPLAGLTYTLE